MTCEGEQKKNAQSSQPSEGLQQLLPLQQSGALTSDADHRGGMLTRRAASGCVTLGGVECQEACHAEMDLTLAAPCLGVALADWLIGAEALLGQ